MLQAVGAGYSLGLEGHLMTRPIKGFWLFLLGMVGLHAGHASATDLVLCDTGIVGESLNPNALHCIDVLAWSWASTTTYTVFPSVGSKINLQDLSLTKYVDSASEDFFRLAATGTPIPGPIEFRAYNPCSGCTSPVPFMTIRMIGVRISSQSTGGSDGESRFTENVTMSYSKISYCYSPTINGALGPKQCYAYNIETGTSISPF